MTMKNSELSTLMLNILEKIEEINLVALGIGIEGGVFGETSLRLPTRLYPSELGFLRVVAWLYVKYYELGKIDVEFLTDKLRIYGLDDSLLFEWNSIPGVHEESFCAYIKDVYDIDMGEKYDVNHIDDENSIRLSNKVNTVLLTKGDSKSVVSIRVGGVTREELPIYLNEGKNIIKTVARSVHPNCIRSLRTYLQHDLSTDDAHDFDVKRTTEKWLIRSCGTPVPEEESQWHIALVRVLKESLDFLRGLLMCLRKMEIDELRDKLIEDWLYQRKRYHPPHEFEKLISVIAEDMGRKGIDETRLRKKYYDEWISELKLHKSGYDFQVEGRKLIERALLDKNSPILPITGNDVIEKLGIAPGPQVGQYLERARQLYLSSPCTSDELLKRLSS